MKWISILILVALFPFACTESNSMQPLHYSFESNDFDKYILIKDADSSFVSEQVNYLKITEKGEKNVDSIKIDSKGNCFIVTFPSEVSLDLFYTMVLDFESAQFPRINPTIGIAISKSNPNYSHHVHLEWEALNKETETDFLAGRFENGTNFLIRMDSLYQSRPEKWYLRNPEPKYSKYIKEELKALIGESEFEKISSIIFTRPK